MPEEAPEERWGWGARVLRDARARPRSRSGPGPAGVRPGARGARGRAAPCPRWVLRSGAVLGPRGVGRSALSPFCQALAAVPLCRGRF